MPLHTIITAEKTVSRASPAFSAGAARMTETISAVSITVTASARTSVPNGSPTRWATTSAWYTAANTLASRTTPAAAATIPPPPANAAINRTTQASSGHVHVHQGVRAPVMPALPVELQGMSITRMSAPCGLSTSIEFAKQSCNALLAPPRRARLQSIDRLTTNERTEGSSNGHGGEFTRDDRGRQNGRQGPLSQSRDLCDRGGDRRLSAHGARTAGDAGDGARLCSHLRRRHPWPQSQSRSSDRRHRPDKTRAYPRHRSAAVYRAAHAAARARWPGLHHVREQRCGRGDRPGEP